MRPSGTTCRQCGADLTPGARFCAGCGTAVGGTDASRVSQPKQMIDGRYLVLQEFGRSAFGSTYLVRDTTADVTRVLKLAAEADPATAQRVAAEARIVGAIRHPNLAGVIGSSLTPKGVPYLVLEHVPGPNLSQILEDGPLPKADALSAALGIADALQALHARQVVHRDVKPENIVVPEEGGAFQFKRASLVDFGVFGELNRRESGSHTTQAGQIFGTPVYMSPEQLSGSAQSAATDVFGLGLVLFEMLTGKRPYGGGNTTEQVFRRLMSEVEIGEEAPLSPSLTELLRGMLRRNPTERISMLQVLSTLRREAAAGRPAGEFGSGPQVGPSPVAGEKPAPPPGPATRLPAPALPSRSGPAVGIIVLAAVLLTVVTISLNQNPSAPPGLTRLFGILMGVATAGGGVGLALLIRHLAANRRPALQVEAGQVLFGAQSRASLTATLAVQVDQLVERCRAMGEAYWGQTVALMLKEYEEAREGKDRREALMNVASLLEKVTTRLSPWYVRYEKLLAVASTSVGILGGGWKIVSEVLTLARAG